MDSPAAANGKCANLTAMQVPAVVDVLRRLDGAARARDLAALCGRAAVRRAFERGDIERVSYGRYALPACGDPLRTALRLSGVVSHVSAAQSWGMDVLTRPSAPHVTVRRSRHGVDRRGVALHWADLSDDQLDERRRVTSPVRTVLDCARTLPLADALSVADSALRMGLISASELSAGAESLAGAGRARISRVAQHADGRSASVLESALRAILIDGSVGGFTPQFLIHDEAFSARVDFADSARRIVLEADSFEHHGGRGALVRDCRRYDELVLRGWRVLRFAWEHVMFEADWVLAAVRSLATHTNSAGRRR